MMLGFKIVVEHGLHKELVHRVHPAGPSTHVCAIQLSSLAAPCQIHLDQ